MMKLVISDNEGTTTVVPLARDEISIGRKDGNTIRLIERNISREHCRLQKQNGGFVVHDLESYNGVLVNGQRVDRELALKAGDELRVGDYTLLLESEEAVKSAPLAEDIEAEPTRIAPLPRSVPPPRLVVLTEPNAGAEFDLPDKGEVVLGRAPELDIALDHRSVSREHAKVACEGAVSRIVDMGSANGVFVNREKVTDARLMPGDVIELGDVVLRYVGPDERYVFDPDEARKLGRVRERVKRPLVFAAGAVVLACIGAFFILRPSHRDSTTSVVAATEPVAAAAAPTEAPATRVEAPPKVDETAHFAEVLEACRAANEGGRYAEAVAHANAALKLRPDAEDAIACRDTARTNNEQEQICVRAKAALQAGDTDAAWLELAGLSTNTDVVRRPEVIALLTSAGRARIAQAQVLLRKHSEQAADVAQSVVEVPIVPAALRAQAQAIVAKAAVAPPTHTATKATRSEVALAAAPASEPAHAAKSAPAVHAAAEKSPMDAASACLARGDNACVVRALNGKAQSAQELGLLIETYRAMGDSAAASKNMATYVQRFPTARRAEAYRQMLERQAH